MLNSLWPHELQHTRLLSSTISQSWLKFMSTESWVMPSNYLTLCHPLLLLLWIFPSIRVFFSESALCSRCTNSWSFSFSISSSNEYSLLTPLGLTGMISLLSKGLSRVFSSTIIWKYQFFELSLLYGPTLTSIYDYWKNHSFDCTDLCQQSGISAF